MDYTNPKLRTAEAASAIGQAVEYEAKPGFWVPVTITDYRPSFGRARWAVALHDAVRPLEERVELVVDGSALRDEVTA